MKEDSVAKWHATVAALALACLPGLAGAEGPPASLPELDARIVPPPAPETRSHSLHSADVGYLSFPLARRYLVENLATGELTAGRRYLRNYMPLAYFFSYEREGKWAAVDAFNRVTTGIGFVFTSAVFSRGNERTHAGVANGPDQMNTGDSITDQVFSVPVFAGADRILNVGRAEFSLGLHLMAWLTKLDTTSTDAVWAAGTASPVNVVSHDSRFLVPLSIELKLSSIMWRTGHMRLGITARAGYMEEARIGNDPNPAVASVGLGPAAIDNQLVIGGQFWYVGLRLY